MALTKDKQREYNKQYFQDNKDKLREQKNEKRREWAAWFVELKSALKCEICSEDHPACLEFHHEGDKDQKVAHMVHFCYSKERILKEIAKCKVYCSNCHQKHHWEEHKG